MLHSWVHFAQSVCLPSWHTPFMPSFNVAIPGTLGQVSHFLLWAPSLPGHASILVIISIVLCFRLFSPKGPAALQGWGQRAYSPSSPSTGDRPALCSVTQTGFSQHPSSLSFPWNPASVSLAFHCCSTPWPRRPEPTTSFIGSTDRQAWF